MSVSRESSRLFRPHPTDLSVPLQGSVHLVPQGRSSAQVYPSSSSFLDKGASDSITRPSRHTCHCRRPLSRLFQATHFPLDNDTILSFTTCTIIRTHIRFIWDTVPGAASTTHHDRSSISPLPPTLRLSPFFPAPCYILPFLIFPGFIRLCKLNHDRWMDGRL